MTVRYEEKPYGFGFGAAKYTRLCCDDRKGWAIVGVDTPRERLQIYVTRTGKVRVYDSKGREWKP